MGVVRGAASSRMPSATWMSRVGWFHDQEADCIAQAAAGARANSPLDCFEEIAARRDDRLDELAVGILVAAVDELGERVDAIGAFVVDAVEIERPERIVGGPHDEEPENLPFQCSSASRTPAVSNAASDSAACPRRSPRSALSSCGRP